jgi:hypothetical protein
MLGKYSLYLYLLILFAAVIVRMILRKKRWQQNTYDPRSNDFDLSDLELLVARGQMTPQEYEKAKAVILSRTDATFQPAKGFPVLMPPSLQQGADKTPRKD